MAYEWDFDKYRNIGVQVAKERKASPPSSPDSRPPAARLAAEAAKQQAGRAGAGASFLAGLGAGALFLPTRQPVSPLPYAAGALAGSLLPLGVAAKGVGLGARLGAAAMRALAPEALGTLSRVPGILRNLAHDAAIGAGYWGLEQAAPWVEEKPTGRDLLRDMAFLAGAGLGLRALGGRWE